MIHTKLEKIMFSVEAKYDFSKVISVTEFITLCMTETIRLYEDDDTNITANEQRLLDGFVDQFITLYNILYSNNLINVIQIFDIFNSKCYNKYTLKEVIF
jgi:hypothetical protein